MLQINERGPPLGRLLRLPFLRLEGQEAGAQTGHPCGSHEQERARPAGSELGTPLRAAGKTGREGGRGRDTKKEVEKRGGGTLGR